MKLISQHLEASNLFDFLSYWGTFTKI